MKIEGEARPFSIWAGTALALSNEKALRLMAVHYNTSLTVIKIRYGELLLFNFNTTPHLADQAEITFR